jgi:dipeptidyl aminopeptidase/acylaminoacyl peptidase
VLGAVAATAFSCHPQPGLGSITLQRRGALHVVDLATCRDRVRPGRLPQPAGLVSPDGRSRATVRATADWWTIVVTRDGRSRELYRVSRHYHVVSEDKGPIELLRWSGDGRWLFFVIDPDGSGSIQADGLTLRVISARGGPIVRLPRMLVYPDYLGWCSGRLVFSAGGDRVATDRKRLLVASPPRWNPRPLVPGTRRVWGALVCAPNGRSLVVQGQRQSSNPSFFATHWALWRVGLDGSRQRLTSPPRGFADESPRFSRDGRVLLFVRIRKGNGNLYALRGGRVAGPILFFGNNTGFYGHHDWWQTAAWSLSR